MDERPLAGQPNQQIAPTAPGHTLAPNSTIPDQPIVTTRKHKKLPLIIVGVAVLATIVGGSAYAVLNRQTSYQTVIQNFIAAVQNKDKAAADLLESPGLQAHGQKTIGIPSFYDACQQANQLCLPLFSSSYLDKASKIYKDYKASNGTTGKEIVYTLKQSLTGNQAGGQGCTSTSINSLTVAAIPHGSTWLIDDVNPSISFSATLCPKTSQTPPSPASSTPQPTTPTNTTPQPKQNTPSTTNPSSKPQSSTQPSNTVAVSNDGCYVAAWGTPGMVLTVYVQKPGGGGGQASYTIPAAGAIEEASGAGNTTETTTGVLYSNGVQVASDTHAVTSNSCSPAG